MTVTRMLGIYFVLFLLFIAACSGGGRSNPTGNDLPGGDSKGFEGTLYGSDGKPLPDTQVTVTDLQGNLLGSDTTDEYGHFRFDLNPSGNYKIFARSGDGTGAGWQYVASDDLSTIRDPGTPSDGGTVFLGGKMTISIPSGEVQELSEAEIFDVDFGAGNPVSFSVQGTNSLVKIRPSMSLDGFVPYMQLAGVRGEHEAFQLLPVLDTGVNSISDVQVTVSDLVKGSDRILKDNITVYKEHYINVTEPSDAGGATGQWPDALVPLTDAFDVQSDMPSPVWVDVNIPRNAVPGVYAGQVRFTTPSNGSYSYTYNLKVWNITIPRRFHMKADFGLDQEDIAAAHGLRPGLMTTDGIQMARKYGGFLAERHISFHGLPLFQPKAYLSTDNRSYELDFTPMDEDICTFMDGYDLPVMPFPVDAFDCMPEGVIGKGDAMFSDNFNARFTDYVGQISAHLSTLGYLDRAYIQLIDEPSTAEEYQLVRDCYNLIHQSSMYPAFMVTEQPAPQNVSWGSLIDSADIFTSAIRCFYMMGGEQNARAGGENKEEWVYTNANVYPYPSFAIDKQGMETRLFIWFLYQHGFDGIYYYSANNWTVANPWENPLTFGSNYGNGCGSLLYPGTVASTYTGQDNVDGPVTSIRLELIRDGLEDSQLLWMLGQGAPVPEANALMTDWFTYSHNPDELLSVRAQIAEALGG